MANILDRITGRDRIQALERQLATLKAQAEQYPAWALATAEARTWDVPDPGIYQNQANLYQKLSWVFQAVDISSNVAAATEIEVLENGEEVEDHDFEKLLLRPNPLQTRFEFLYNTYAFRKLNGNAFWWLNRPNEKAPPAELWLLPPSSIRIVPDGNLYIRGYLYDPGNGAEIPLEPWEILHFHGFHPSNWWMGMGGIEPIATTATGDLAMSDFNARLFKESNGKLAGLLAFADNIEEGEWKQMLADIRENARKRDMMVLRNVKQGGVQWLKIADSMKEMEFLASRKNNREEIYNTLAPGLFSWLSESANLSNSRSGATAFGELTIYPMLEALTQAITKHLMPTYGDSFTCSFPDMRSKDRALELQEEEAYGRSHTIDEIREKFHKDKPLAEITKIETDERGKALPAQISPTVPIPTDKPPEPETPAPVPGAIPNPADETTTVTQPLEIGETTTAQAVPQDAMAEDLGRWKRKSLNALKAGKAPAVDFESDLITAKMRVDISSALLVCKTAADVRAAFDVTPVKSTPTAADIIQVLSLAIEGMKRENLA